MLPRFEWIVSVGGRLTDWFGLVAKDAPAVWLLILWCLAIFVLVGSLGGWGYLTGFGARIEMLWLYDRVGLVPDRVGRGYPAGLVGLLSGVFVHVGPIHLAVNMLGLRAFGKVVDDLSGPEITWLVFLFGGVMSGLCHVVVYGDSTLVLVGSSGAVSGLLGYVVFQRGLWMSPRWSVGVGRWRVRTWWLAGFWLLQQVFYLGLGVLDLSDLSETALVVHVGGLGAGLVAGWVVRLAVALK